MPDIASVFGQNEFAIRRLHSLTGLVPVGSFLVVHLLTNAAILDGSYQARVDQIHSLGPLTLLIVEWVFIFLPILFHGIIGLIIVARGHRNVFIYPYRENIRYTLQRWTGVIAFAFILWHVFQTRGWITGDWWLKNITRPLGGGTFDAHDAAASAAAAIQASLLVLVLYVVGVVASVYHFTNGLWTMGITWGVWTAPRSQGWATTACTWAGVILMAIALVALAGFQLAEAPLTP